MTIPGISYYSSLLITAEIGEVDRFPREKKLVSYAGLDPTVRQSGDRELPGGISKDGPDSMDSEPVCQSCDSIRRLSEAVI